MIPTLKAWHDLVRNKDASALNDLIAEDAVFYSPVMHTPQAGKKLVIGYLTAAAQVFLNDSFQYLRELIGTNEAMLEFKVVIDDIEVNGIDHIQWNDDSQIVSFKVWLRPLKGIQVIQQKMAAQAGLSSPVLD
ncbi:MAG: hypothetical protein QF485_02320 [Arenicellales bacterium]|nr:hypothetical protein [Arenicellales bacterium]